MTETVREAKHELHNAKRERREKVAAYWRNTVEQGRVLRQEAAQQRQEGQEQKPHRQQQ